MNDTDSTINTAITRFRELGVRAVAPTHCSGESARQRFARAYGADFLTIGVGSSFSSENIVK